MTPLQDQASATVGDTIWVTRTVALPAGHTLRAADWQGADPIELLGPARVTVADGRAAVAYPVAVWRPGTHTVEVPGPLLLGADGRVDSVPGETITLSVASVLPRAATDTSLRPQPRADFVSRPSTTAIPLLLLLLLAVALLIPLHRWWRRRGAPVRTAPPAGADAGARPELDRWAEAGEGRAVAAVASTRLRLTLAARVPGALSSLDTESVLAHVAAQRPDWPLAELGEVLRDLDRARFGAVPPPDALVLARRATDLEPRLVPEAA